MMMMIFTTLQPATSPLQNNLQAVHSDVQHPSREVSMLPA